MKRVLLIGDPVEHSLSPAMHNAAFLAAGIDARYEARRVTSAELGGVVQELHREPWLGANVTIPHKEAVLGLVDSHSPLVDRIGAANTLVREGDRVRAHNTDARGFAESVRQSGIDPRGKRALVLGAGGAARAIIAALLDAEASCDVYARRRPQAAALTATFRDRGVAAIERPHSVRPYDLVVNATPLGLHGEDPLRGLPLPSDVVVVDIVPMAEETPLVRRARAAGCVTIDGLPMLLYQAAASFELWTGKPAPLDAMRRALPRAA